MVECTCTKWIEDVIKKTFSYFRIGYFRGIGNKTIDEYSYVLRLAPFIEHIFKFDS